MHRRILRLAAAGVGALAFALIPVIASAHVVFTTGAYRIAMGWQFEPSGGNVTYVGQPNGIQVFIDQPTADNDIGTPVGDLNQDCTHPDFQITVKVGTTTSSPFCLLPVYDADTARGRMDEYGIALTPTKVGDYTFHFFGTIHGTPVDKTFTSGPSTFDTVGDQNAAEFPTAVPAVSDLTTKVNQVGGRAADALTTANNASSSANGATTLAIVALIVAIVLGAANLAVGLIRRRA